MRTAATVPPHLSGFPHAEDSADRPWHSLHFWLTVGTIFFIIAVFRLRDYDDKSLDFQTLLRLMAWANAALYCLVFTRISLSVLVSFTLLPWTLFHLYAVVRISEADNWTFGLTTSVSLLIFYVWTAVICQRFGTRFLIEAIVVAMLFIAIGSFVTYFVYPELARLPEWVGNVRLPSNRMSGIAGSANGLGMACAMTVTLLVLYWRDIRLPLWVKTAAFAFCTIDLALSINRISILSAAICITLYFIFVKKNGLVLLVSLFGTIVSALLFFGLGDDFLVLLSRSGNVSEITTGTGRAEIWLTVIDLWQENMIFGWGHGAAISILPYRSNLFTAAAHPHNLFLEVLFSRGLVGFFFFVSGIVIAVGLALRQGNARGLILFVLFLVAGTTESIAISGRAGLAVVVLSLAVFEMTGVISNRPGAASTQRQGAVPPWRRPRRLTGRAAA